jgi:hypothetical protein
MRTHLFLSAAALALALAAPATTLNAQAPGITIGNADLGGVVSGPNGPEAGVWVIAETNDLGTKFAKMVVTDDQGRYVLPELPKAKYKVWVRGYGLVDSAKVDSEPGKILNLTATIAPSPAAAAEYYPAIYWWAMLQIPQKSEFPGTGPQVRLLPSVGQQGYTHDPKGARRVQDLVRRLGAARAIRTGERDHGPQHGTARHPARVQAVRGVDRPRRWRRAAVREAAATAGYRAQRRRDCVGLGQPQDVPAR